MNVSQFDNIRVVLAEPSATLRKTLKECLIDHGFRSVLDTGNLAQVAGAVREGNVDLLIADTSLPEGDFNAYVNELRHGKHGENPFLVIMTLVSDPNTDSVHAAINSGTDHVLAKPFSPLAMINHAKDLTHGRKKFVVTTDYIGPDRRTHRRSEGMAVERIDVPNALRQRMTGQMSEGIVRRAIDAAKAKINDQKVVRHAYQIGWLLDRMLPEVNAAQKSTEFENHMKRLGSVADDISRRIRTTQYAHVAEMCMTLNAMVASASKNGFTMSDAHLLAKIAGLIGAAFDPEREEYVATYRRNRQLPGILPSDTEEPSVALAASA